MPTVIETMIAQTVLILTINAHLAHAVKTCCDKNNNFVASGRCVDGTMANIQKDCKVFTINANSSEFQVLDNDRLAVDNHELSPDEYCLTTKLNTTKDVYLICFQDMENMETINILNFVCEGISVFFITLTVVVYVSLPEMMDLQGIAIVNSISGKAFGYTLLIAINAVPHLEEVECHIAAYLLYVTMMYAFFWLNVLSFHIWRQVINPDCLKAIKNWKMIYYAFGICGPLACFIFMAVMQHGGPWENIHPGIAENGCWFKSLRETMIYFYAPITILILVNTMYFVWTIIILSKQYTRSRTTQVFKYRLRLYIKLFFIMGIAWMFEVISAVSKRTLEWLWIFTDIINSLEGLTIFLVLVVFRRKVMRGLASKSVCRCLKLPSEWRNLEDTECEPIEEDMNMT